MGMLARLFLLMTIVPVVELYLLIQLGARIGPVPTVALVVFTGLLGATLARREGLKAFRELQESLRMGVPPAEGLLNGALIVLGGVLLITPGVLTDLLGVALLVPPSRRKVARWLRRRLELRLNAAVPGGWPGPRGRGPGGGARRPFPRGETEAEVIEPPAPDNTAR